MSSILFSAMLFYFFMYLLGLIFIVATPLPLNSPSSFIIHLFYDGLHTSNSLSLFSSYWLLVEGSMIQ